MIRAIVISFLITLSILTLVHAVNLSRQRGGFGGVEVSVPLPALPLKNEKSEPVTLDSTAFGGKVTVINFFASWCTPCQAEMPELVALKKESNVQFHGIVWNDQPQVMQGWLKQYGNPFDMVWYDDTGLAASALKIRGVPETFIVDKKGVVRFHVTGIIKPEISRDKLLPLLTKLAGE